MHGSTLCNEWRCKRLIKIQLVTIEPNNWKPRVALAHWLADPSDVYFFDAGRWVQAYAAVKQIMTSSATSASLLAASPGSTLPPPQAHRRSSRAARDQSRWLFRPQR